MKVRGSTVDLILASPSHTNGHSVHGYGGLPVEEGCNICPSLVGDGMINQLCPPFSFPWMNAVSEGSVPVGTNDGIPCLPKHSAVSKVGPPFICSQLSFAPLLLCLKLYGLFMFVL